MNKNKSLWFWGLLCGLSLPVSALANVSGTVYRDFNANGVKENTASFDEIGVQGVTVTAYDSSGAMVGLPATTAVDGTYTIAGVSGAVRVEFSGQREQDFNSPVGSNSGTSIQFVTAPASNIDLGLSYSDHFFDTDPSSMTYPNIMFTSETNGDPLGGGTAGQATTVFMSPYDVTAGIATETGGGSAPNPTHVSTAAQTGSVWGIALQRETDTLFASTFLRRHMGLGPGKDGNGQYASGAVYSIDVSSGATFPNASYFFSLDELGFPTQATGVYNDTPFDPTNYVIGSNSDRVLDASSGQPTTDAAAWTQVGRASLGDMDISDDGKYLWLMNLYDKNLYRVFVDNPSVAPTVADVMAFPVTNPSCTDGSHYPWAVKWYRGSVYYGVVCSAENDPLALDESVTAMATRAKLQAYVYALNPLTGTSTQVLNIPLDYQKGCALGASCSGLERYWGNWNFFDKGNREYASPILADIEFDVEGSMIIGLMDRESKMRGYKNAEVDDGASPGTSEAKYTNGDILRAYYNPVTANFELESNGKEGASSPKAATAGAGNTEGIGGGEFYYGDSKEGNVTDGHREISLAGLAILPGTGETLLTAYDPEDWHSGGLIWIDNTTGYVNKPYTVAWSADSDDAIAYYGKSGGLGDIEVLADFAPLEIGNRIWDDTNGNGVQDAGEAGIDGVNVILNCGGADFTQTTSNGGQYLFNDANVAGGIPRDTACTITVPTTVSGDSLTLRNNALNEPLGSNPDTSTGSFSFTTGSAGQNNHTYDIGYRNAPAGGSITIIKDATPDDAQDFSFTATGTGLSNFSLDDDSDATLSNSQTFSGLSDGAYSITEAATANWTLAGINCSGATNSTVTINATGVNITLSNNEDISCTFYNNNHTCPAGQLLNQVTVTASEGETTYTNNTAAACLDIATSSCSLTASAVVSSCTNVGSDADSSNDTFTIDLTVEGNNTNGSTSYSYTSSSANISGNGTYSATAETDGAFVISSSTSPFSLTIEDDNDASCSTTVTNLVAPATCSSATPQVDLELVKTASPTSALSGETVTYTLIISNNGPSDATGIQVQDQLPAGVSYTGDTPSQGSYDSGTGIWIVGDIANGANATLDIMVTLD